MEATRSIMEAAVNNGYGCQTCAGILVCSRPQHGLGAGHHAEGDVVCQMIVNVKHNLAYIRHVSYGLQLQADGLNTQSGMQYMFKAKTWIVRVHGNACFYILYSVLLEHRHSSSWLIYSLMVSAGTSRTFSLVKVNGQSIKYSGNPC